MVMKKVEMNDKLKSVQLIKALGVDGTFKRDILAKVNFNQEPKKVYEETKTAIRDICGDKLDKQKEALEERGETNVHIVKPWQDDKHSSTPRGRDRERYSRSQSGERRGRDRYSRSRSRDGRSSRFRDRSFSGDLSRTGAKEKGGMILLDQVCLKL